MRKFDRFKRLVLVMIGAIVSFGLVLPTQSSIAEGDSLWSRIVRGLFGNGEADGEPLASRGDFCPIAPAMVNETVASSHPYFIWWGSLDRMKIHATDGSMQPWDQDVSQVSAVTYDGETPLEWGKTYELYLFLPHASSPSYIIPFQVVLETEHDQITQDIQALEEQFTNENVSSETIALERARYFAEKQLRLDAWREIFSVELPSDEFNAQVNELFNQLCKSSSGAANGT